MFHRIGSRFYRMGPKISLPSSKRFLVSAAADFRILRLKWFPIPLRLLSFSRTGLIESEKRFKEKTNNWKQIQSDADENESWRNDAFLFEDVFPHIAFSSRIKAFKSHSLKLTVWAIYYCRLRSEFYFYYMGSIKAYGFTRRVVLFRAKCRLILPASILSKSAVIKVPLLNKEVESYRLYSADYKGQNSNKGPAFQLDPFSLNSVHHV